MNMSSNLGLWVLFCCVNFIRATPLNSVSSRPLLFETVKPSPDVNQSAFAFDDIYSGKFYPRTFSVSWIKDTETFFYSTKKADVMLYNATDDTESLYLPESLLKELRATGHYVCNSDKNFVLFAYHFRPLWRHSFTAKFLIYNLETKKKYYFPNGPIQNESLSYAAWSPVKYALLFVYKNNLYIQNGIDELPQQVTFDGDSGISNGVPDWLYEEEILEHLDNANVWSPSGRFLFHSKFDASDNPKQYWFHYGRDSNVYGRLKQVHYPKAGFSYSANMPGPTTYVDLFITDTEGINLTTTRLSPPVSLRQTYHYFLHAAWRDDRHILVVWSNRVQNMSISILYDVENPSEMTEILTTSQSNGWIEVPHPKPWFLQNGEQYLTILPHQSLSKPSRQIAIVTCKRGVKDKVTFLTQGEQVESIVGVNRKTGFVYYITWYHVKGRQLWRLKIPSLFPPTGTYPLADCLYCHADDYIEASFSTSSENYVIDFLGPNVPKYILKSTVMGKEYKSITMENNAALKESLKTRQWPTKEYFQYQNGDGSVGYGQMLIPPNPGKDEFFPLLVYTYAGPGTQIVNTKFLIQKPYDIWLLHLATHYRIVIVWTDGRGSMSDGDDLKFAVYKKLGTVEVEDQMLGVEYVKKNAGVKISNYSAIFGWSYGGFVAGHALANENDTFMCAVSVAPTTNKGIYDTAYTERYLGLITEPEGPGIYSRTNLVHKAKFFKNKKYFIAHGLADDNVHYNHFAHLVRELQKHQVMFRQNTYPDEDHAIATVTEVNKHLFRSIIDFLINDCWPARYQEDTWSFSGFFHSIKDFVKGIF